MTEAANDNREQFGDARLSACLSQPGSCHPDKFIRRVLDAVEVFAEGTRQADDITMVALQYTDNGQA